MSLSILTKATYHTFKTDDLWWNMQRPVCSSIPIVILSIFTMPNCKLGKPSVVLCSSSSHRHSISFPFSQYDSELKSDHKHSSAGESRQKEQRNSLVQMSSEPNKSVQCWPEAQISPTYIISNAAHNVAMVVVCWYQLLKTLTTHAWCVRGWTEQTVQNIIASLWATNMFSLACSKLTNFCFKVMLNSFLSICPMTSTFDAISFDVLLMSRPWAETRGV